MTKQDGLKNIVSAIMKAIIQPQTRHRLSAALNFGFGLVLGVSAAVL